MDAPLDAIATPVTDLDLPPPAAYPVHRPARASVATARIVRPRRRRSRAAAPMPLIALLAILGCVVAVLAATA